MRRTWRRNSDAGLRSLERRFATGEDVCAQLVRARLRAGSLPRFGVVASMLLGNECAREALGIKPRLTPYMPYGFVVGNGWEGPWPDCCVRVHYAAHSGRWEVQGSGPVGHLLDVLSHLGPEYWLAFAAVSVRHAHRARRHAEGLITYGPTSYPDPARDPPLERPPELALMHARYMAIEGGGDMDPRVAHELGVRAMHGEAMFAQINEGAGESELAEVFGGAGAVARAASSGPPSDMIRHSIDAMAHAANVILVPHWEDILWESMRRTSGPRTDEGQWGRADELLKPMYAELDRALSPWLLGFAPGPPVE